MEDLDLVCDRDHARARRERLAGEPRRKALPVPALVHLEHDPRDRSGQTDPLREPRSRLAVRANGVVEEPPSDSDPHDDTAGGAAERLAPHLLSHRPQPLAKALGVRAHVRGDALELAGPDPSCALVGERGAPDGMNQRRVVRVASLLLVETELLGEPRSDERRPQRLLLREAAAEVGRERNRCKELREAELWRRTHVPHSLTAPGGGVCGHGPRSNHRARQGSGGGVDGATVTRGSALRA